MKITVKCSAMVKPTAETPRGNLWLSKLDLIMPGSYHTRTVYFYRFVDGEPNFFEPAVLKAALGRALVEFYPFAGRLTEDGNNRIAIDCNSEGELFVEAECDGALDNLGDFRPKPDLVLVSAVDYSGGISTFPLMVAQLTRFRCGGVSLGIANEHHLVDGLAALHFIKTWADFSRGSPIVVPPSFDRSVLAARSPPQPKFDHIEYHPPPTLKTPLPASETAFSVFELTRDQVASLKAICNGSGSNYSTYKVVTGHLWRCMCAARALAGDQETKLHIAVDGRDKLRPPLPSGYFGNAIFLATPVALCGEIVSNPLKFTVAKIDEAIGRVGEEYMRSALDYLELQSNAGDIATGTHKTKCPNLKITSWVWLPFYDSDFGWGKPVYVGPGVAPTEGKSYLLRSPANDGTLLYAVALLKEHMDRFEKLIYDI